MSPAKRHMARVAAAGCALGNRRLHQCEDFPGQEGKIHVHHIAEGSGVRSDFATVGLCWGGHQGQAGIHGMGVRAFCRLYRPPGECEWGLLAWANEDCERSA
jgi:hypothetical protein